MAHVDLPVDIRIMNKALRTAVIDLGLFGHNRIIVADNCIVHACFFKYVFL
ncbi:hypothetical protein D3C85_1624510 [compost metagenome]